MLNILENESDPKKCIEKDYEGKMTTNMPASLMELFSEAFQVVQAKKIKNLMLKMLSVYKDMTK